MNDMSKGIDSHRQPVVFTRDGEVFASSRDVAAFFEKQHGHVLRDIDALIAAEPKLGRREMTEDRVSTFGETVETRANPSGGAPISSRAYLMTRDGFTLLAMGFTGPKALRFKMAYIAAFNVMESELRSRPVDPMVVLGDPAALRGLLLTYTEKVQKLESTVKEQAVDVAAFDRLAKSDGALCITDAAKTLGIKQSYLPARSDLPSKINSVFRQKVFDTLGYLNDVTPARGVVPNPEDPLRRGQSFDVVA